MGGIYPNNQDIEIFGEQMSWPGVDASGKFTNGSFTDPMVKPSFIPAETVNLIFDNLSALIEKCGGVPNATGGGQLAGIASYLAEAQKIVRRDGAGRAKVAAPSAMQALSERCNGEGVADFRGLQIGDYIDGLDLSGIPAEGGGGAGQPWNDGYKNNRIAISGLNTYKGIGDTENRRNHIMFTFRNIPLRKRMNPTNTSTGGYPSSELRAFLEGANGNGTGGRESWNTNIHLPVFSHSSFYRIKRYNGVRSWWWMSSPAASASVFAHVTDIGHGTRYTASSLGGCAPAFCVA